MSLSAAERDAAFLFYSLAFAGTPMPVPLPTVFSNDEEVSVAILAAAISLGARGHMRGADPLTRAEVAEAVEDALEEAPAPDAASAPDATLAALEAYADGVEDALVALEKWMENNQFSGDLAVRGWIAARRNAGPKRGMTARDVLDRIGAWMRDESDNDCHNVSNLHNKIMAEIEGGPHV